MQELILEDIIQSNPSNLTKEEINGEIVMMDFLNGNYILLNKMSSIIWKEIEKPILIRDLINILKKRFNVESEVCIKETLICLNKLNQQNLIIKI
jgi:hypothetical protein